MMRTDPRIGEMTHSLPFLSINFFFPIATGGKKPITFASDLMIYKDISKLLWRSQVTPPSFESFSWNTTKEKRLALCCHLVVVWFFCSPDLVLLHGRTLSFQRVTSKLFYPKTELIYHQEITRWRSLPES